MGQVFSIPKIINTYETTPDYNIRPTVPLSYFQEAAQRQTDMLGIGTEFLLKNNLAWILIKYEVNYIKYPKAEETVYVETEPVGLRSFEAYRRFAIVSKNGEKMITAKSVWMLVNTKTGKPVRCSSIKELETLSGDNTEVYKIAKLTPMKSYDHEREFRVRYLDIDINQHVNNVNYFAWAIESIPLDIVREYEIERVRIVYRSQAFYGETVIVKSGQPAPMVWRADVFKADSKTLLCEIEIDGRERSEAFPWSQVL